jgi:carbon storage regulator CsrA
MLVVSRKVDESISLPELGITVTIGRIDNKRVQLLVDAPREVKIQRDDAAMGRMVDKAVKG